MKPMRKKAVDSLCSECLYVTSGALARKVEKLAIEVWKPAGLPPSHAYLLLLVIHSDICYPSWISQDLMLSPSTVTRLMEKLEKMDLISRTPYEHLICISPTQKAWDLEPVLSECELTFERRCREIFGEGKMTGLNLLINMATDKLAARELRTG